MQLTLALLTTLLTATTLAAPSTSLSKRSSYPQITVSLIDDRTGASAKATVLGDGLARNITDLFHGTVMDRNGSIIATSAQLTQFADATKCFFQNYNWIINMNGRELQYVDLDGDEKSAAPVILNGFNLQCQ
ncbi:hypothetical protein BCR34DRAFT_561822 [Clohesyomyces aquaticus]|uniref:Uncharacterized protein n=1 Tax=Clohesyomyces aquaticus TaxID=1231657 RepID=A0A1Y1ZTT8_9PLEO|nr:hypothetical protein BCR34DRAFT_561822 [Clohesyomyces aquaticus]